MRYAVADTVNEWNVEDEYSPFDLFTRATDTNGHKETLHVPLPPYLLNRMQAFVGDAKVVGYRSVQDLARDAVVHRMHYWATDMPAEQKRAWLTTLRRVQLEQKLWEIEQEAELLETYRGGMEAARVRALWGALSGLVDDCQAHADELVLAGVETAGLFVALADEYRDHMTRQRARR